VSNAIVERVVELAAEIFGVSSEDLSVDTTPADVDSWDSVALLNLMVALEDEYSIQFNAEDADDAESLGAIATLVAARST
jgi:acyl carrier protein